MCGREDVGELMKKKEVSGEWSVVSGEDSRTCSVPPLTTHDSRSHDFHMRVAWFYLKHPDLAPYVRLFAYNMYLRINRWNG